MTLIPTILSLCDLSGAWSAPYREAGYHVVQIDLGLNGQDVRLMRFPGSVQGILAAPPCDWSCRPGARLWNEWGEAKVLSGMSVVDACLRLVAVCRPVWWALENPPGRIREYLGDPALNFQPWHYGDPWTKQTYLWGSFTPPVRTPVQPEAYPGHLAPGKRDRTSRMSSSQKAKRAETPPGFARAFFKANP